MDGTRAGFSLTELLLVMTIGSILAAVVIGLLMVQQQDYVLQKEIASDQRDLRSGLTFLASELRGLSPSDGDLTTIGAQSIVTRSRRGAGVVCGIPTGAAQPTFDLFKTGGEFLAESADSALLFVAGGADPSDDAYRVLKVTKVSSSPSLTCDYPVSPALKASVRIEVAGDTSGIAVGAMAFAFRQTEYGLFQLGSEWWLGRRVAGASTWEPLMGPLDASTEAGLEFVYYDAAGNVTAVPANVTAVDISLWRPAGSNPRWFESQGDSIISRVYLRN